MPSILRNTAVTLIAVIALYWLTGFYGTALRDPRVLDGWVLCGGMCAQLLFHIRKKLPASPLGKAASWLKVHVYAGYFVIAAFLFHTSFSLPESLFEWTLWTLFVVVVVSGLVGLYLSASIPAKLQEQGYEQITFEQIPAARQKLSREINALVLESVTQTGSPEISEFYVHRLRNFFRKPQNMRAHLRGSRRPLDRICNELDDLERYADAKGGKLLSSIKTLVVAKYDLDHQYAFQGLLQSWSFVHVPATYCLVVLSILHVAIVYAYSSGVQ